MSVQFDTMPRRILAGYAGFSMLLAAWLQEADERGLLRPGVNCSEVADHIIINLNGATALFAASRDGRFLQTRVEQTRSFVESLRRS